MDIKVPSSKVISGDDIQRGQGREGETRGDGRRGGMTQISQHKKSYRLTQTQRHCTQRLEATVRHSSYYSKAVHRDSSVRCVISLSAVSWRR